MLANIRGKGRALDEKSERLLMEQNMSPGPEGEINRRLLPTASLGIGNGLGVWCGIGQKRNGGVHQTEAFSHLPVLLLKLCCWLRDWVILLERCVVHCWSHIRFSRESTKCNKHFPKSYFRDVQKLWRPEEFNLSYSYYIQPSKSVGKFYKS